jgi:hypothetical protein
LCGYHVTSFSRSLTRFSVMQLSGMLALSTCKAAG